MTLKFLLDTNVLSEPLRPAPNSNVLERLRMYQGEITIPSIVWHELWFGCLRLPDSPRRSAIETYLRKVVGPSIPILPYDEHAAAWHASERARLTAQGKTPPFTDGQIAAIAHTNDLALVTFNTTDYTWFSKLVVVDWRD